eukprot:3783488-Pleurochrysis_carterae.AAC.1
MYLGGGNELREQDVGILQGGCTDNHTNPHRENNVQLQAPPISQMRVLLAVRGIPQQKRSMKVKVSFQ